MDDLLVPLQDLFEAQIDFHGQRIAEHLCTGLLTIFAAIAFIVGYTYEDVHLTLWIGLAGTLITAMVVVPPWPMYNKHPEPWLIAGSGGVGREGIVVDGGKR
ncbi:signal peptidase complex subunit 1 [[Emmonsia] crescens]|uniref:Signal peptidase complex subunit 1 n=1 Tax=[Emmonsia] crescens TaxID=73230 RepID=A0A2B7Z625_9EURO|nr:signal peptidase complex subunit 1 [Emmonsia crescens]